jgi:hypothetical protein
MDNKTQNYIKQQQIYLNIKIKLSYIYGLF